MMNGFGDIAKLALIPITITLISIMLKMAGVTFNMSIQTVDVATSVRAIDQLVVLLVAAALVTARMWIRTLAR